VLPQLNLLTSDTTSLNGVVIHRCRLCTTIPRPTGHPKCPIPESRNTSSATATCMPTAS
jgi:hypothetical protein